MRLMCRKYAYSFLELLLKSEPFAFLLERVKSAIGKNDRPDVYLLYDNSSEYSLMCANWIDVLFPTKDESDSNVKCLISKFASNSKLLIKRISQPPLRPLLTFLSLVHTLHKHENGIANFNKLLAAYDQHFKQAMIACFEGSPDSAKKMLEKLLPRNCIDTFAQVCSTIYLNKFMLRLNIKFDSIENYHRVLVNRWIILIRVFVSWSLISA